MRVCVQGDGLSAKAVRSWLALEGFAVVPSDVPHTHCLLIDHTDGELPVVDGIDCQLERMVVAEIAAESGLNVILKRCGGIQSDNRLRVLVPSDPLASAHIESGIVKGFGRFAGRMPPPPKPFWRRRGASFFDAARLAEDRER